MTSPKSYIMLCSLLSSIVFIAGCSQPTTEVPVEPVLEKNEVQNVVEGDGQIEVKKQPIAEAVAEIEAEVEANPAALVPTGDISTLEGKDLYMMICAACHGQQLQGGVAQSLVDGVWQFGASKSAMKKNIKHGITHLGMPTFENMLTDKQINSVIKFIQETGEQEGAVRPPAPKTLQTLEYEIEVDVFVEGVEIPWSIDFLDARTALITERPGRLRMVTNGVLAADPVANIPTVHASGQGGLLDVAVDPNYAENGWVYLSYSHALEVAEGEPVPAMTRIARGKIVDNAWTSEEVIFTAKEEHYKTKGVHYGSRIVFDKAGFLYFSVGDRGDQDNAQDLSLPNGKIHRIHLDGSIPEDNPFVNTENAYPSIFSYGHRNPQGLAIHPGTDLPWETEHGPMGGDEINRPKKGLNYGWPVVTYGRNYNGTIVSEHEHAEGYEEPVLFWRPSLATCGLDFYEGEAFGRWNNHLLSGSLRYEELRLLTVTDERVMHSEVILKGAGRVRDVTVGPDGFIYVALNTPDQILRLRPTQERTWTTKSE